MAEYFIGLMSGTSLDGLDAVLVDFSTSPPQLIATASTEYGAELRSSILALTQPGDNELDRLAQLDVQLGRISAELCLQLLQLSQVSPAQIQAIGSHGQTLRHAPLANPAYTMQIGDPNTIAQLTGITTVADFRRRDIAAGGQGAPLVPAFHQAVFHNNAHDRILLNIGGIANITILPSDPKQRVTGFDTGPGNMLLDAWIQHKRSQPYDANGVWACSGNLDTTLLEKLLDDPYYDRPPPKSTGREHFNLQWLQQNLCGSEKPQDVQTTLCELSAITIARAITRFAPASDEIYICGGGANNGYLLGRLAALLPGCRIATTDALGISTQWVEAMAFAWLAHRTLRGLSGNLPAVTGAQSEVILGGIYPA